MRDMLLASDAWIVRPGPVAGGVAFIYALVRGAAFLAGGRVLNHMSTAWLVVGSLFFVIVLGLHADYRARQRRGDADAAVAEACGRGADRITSSVRTSDQEDRP